MNIDMPVLISIIDRCLIDTGTVMNGRRATIPVKTVATAVVVAAGSGPESYPEILKMVCQRTIAKGHALAFYDTPADPEMVTRPQQPLARLH